MQSLSHSSSEPRHAADQQPAAELLPMPEPHLRRMELLFIWGFWAIIALLMCLSTLLNPSSYPGSSATLLPPLLGSILEALIWALLTPVIFAMARRFTLDHPQWLLRLLMMILVGVALSWLVFESMTKFRTIEQQWFDVPTTLIFWPDTDPRMRFIFKLWQFFEFAVFLVILTAGIAKDYLQRYRLFQSRYAQLRVELADAHLQTLQDQLNPHFLFNTLNGISSLVTRDPDKAQDMLAQLSELLRDTLERKELEVTLEAELNFVKRYLGIMQARFGDKLATELQIDPQTLAARVPNLILQPLVENAIKHGVDKLDAIGQISISAQREQDELVLQVRDNGDATVTIPAASGSGLGLRNTRQRLQQSYGEHHSLKLERQAQGMLAEIRIPFHTYPMHQLSGTRRS